MPLRLTFGKQSVVQREPVYYEGPDATAVVDSWNATPEFRHMSPSEFGEYLVSTYGLDLDLPVDDHELLEAVVAADREERGTSLFQDLKLEEVPGNVAPSRPGLRG